MSFVWGAAIFGEETKVLALALVGLLILFIGIAGKRLPLILVDSHRNLRGGN